MHTFARLAALTSRVPTSPGQFFASPRSSSGGALFLAWKCPLIASWTPSKCPPRRSSLPRTILSRRPSDHAYDFLGVGQLRRLLTPHAGEMYNAENWADPSRRQMRHFERRELFHSVLGAISAAAFPSALAGRNASEAEAATHSRAGSRAVRSENRQIHSWPQRSSRSSRRDSPFRRQCDLWVSR